MEPFLSHIAYPCDKFQPEAKIKKKKLKDLGKISCHTRGLINANIKGKTQHVSRSRIIALHDFLRNMFLPQVFIKKQVFFQNTAPWKETPRNPLCKSYATL